MAGRSEVRSPKHYGHTRRQGADPIAAELAGIDFGGERFPIFGSRGPESKRALPRS